MSEKPGGLTAALCRARIKFGPIKKNREGQARGGRYQYSDLSEILDAIMPALIAEEIYPVQVIRREEDGAVCLVSQLRHAGGEVSESVYPLPVGASPQEFGSALTYGRRYLIAAQVMVAADSDDDGAAATEAHKDERPKLKPSDPAPSGDPRAELASAVKVLASMTGGDPEAICRAASEFAGKEGKVNFFLDPLAKRRDGSWQVSDKWASGVLGKVLKQIEAEEGRGAEDVFTDGATHG